jgi:phosphotriesterase-related protein
MHEHVFVLDPEVLWNFPTDWDERRGMQAAVERLDALRSANIDSILDPTVYGLGRNIPLLLRVAAQTALNIVVATGAYVFTELPQYFKFRGIERASSDPDLLTELFVRDIRVGVLDTGVRAGVLKCATDEPGVTPDVERVLRATAQAQLVTGVPITTHTHAATQRGLDQQRIFAEEGVDLSRVIIGHCGDTADLRYLEQLLDNGSYLGMDRFGLDHFLSVEDRIGVVAELCHRGWSQRLVLSHDCAVHNDWFDADWQARITPRHSFRLITDAVLPALAERGVSDAQIEEMLVHNPRRLLTRAGT